MSDKIQLVEIDLNKCQLSYGVAPCTAAGTDKCFNSRKTCQDLANIDLATETVRYSMANNSQRIDLLDAPSITIPSIASIDYMPPELKLGESIGIRASLDVKFRDHRSPDTDASGDPYIVDRSYDPFRQGTYWGKFRARHPFIRGQALRWIQGDINQNIEDMEIRHFVVESTMGPDSNGNFSVTAKDVLKLTDGDRSTAPVAQDIETGMAVAAGYTGNLSITSGAAALIPDSGYIVLGGVEIVSYQRLLADPTFTTLTILARAQFNTPDTSHSIGALVQDCVYFSGEDPADIFYSLLVNYANVNPSFVPLSDWQAESAEYINRSYTSIIPRPVAVVDLINELLEQTGSTMWWDNQAQQIKWQVLRRPTTSPVSYDDSIFMQTSLNISDNYQRRVSRVWVFFGQINPLLNLTDDQNYSTRVVRRSESSELDAGGVPAIKQIFSRWIPSAGRDTAERLGDLILQRFSTPPRLAAFRLMRNQGITEPSLGGAYTIANQFIQNPDGTSETVPVQITSLSPSVSSYTVKAEEITFDSIVAPIDPNVVPVSIDTNTNNVNLRTLYDQIAPEPTALTVVNCTISSGVIVGSLNSGVASFDTGTWPAGVTLNLYNQGKIVGKGGQGGEGSSITKLTFRIGSGINPSVLFTATDALNGENGGDALNIQHDINIDNTNGLIAGAGGGGGGSVSGFSSLTDRTGDSVYDAYCGYSAGAGGGGGAGSYSGSGGNSGSTSNISALASNKLPIYTPPPPATAGGFNTGGDSTAGFSQVLFDYPSGVDFTYSVLGVAGGAGGDLGQAGSDGGDTMTSSPPVGIYPDYVSNGVNESVVFGTGGAAGNAIVQNGNTVNIIATGTIIGSII